MKILLIYPKWTQNYGMISYFAKKASVWPPLNLAYLAAIAEAQGHTVRILDGEAQDIPLTKMIKSLNSLSERLKSFLKRCHKQFLNEFEVSYIANKLTFLSFDPIRTTLQITDCF